MEEFQTLVPLGVGGILAGMMFMFYRKDSNMWTEAWKGQTNVLIQVVKENTTAITALITEIHSQKRQ